MHRTHNVIDLGKVQVLGSDFHFRDVKPKMEQFIRSKPRRADCTSTILLLHNPFHFKFVPEGYVSCETFLTLPLRRTLLTPHYTGRYCVVWTLARRSVRIFDVGH
jgi:hypothetical protein